MHLALGVTGKLKGVVYQVSVPRRRRRLARADGALYDWPLLAVIAAQGVEPNGGGDPGPAWRYASMATRRGTPGTQSARATRSNPHAKPAQVEDPTR